MTFRNFLFGSVAGGLAAMLCIAPASADEVPLRLHPAEWNGENAAAGPIEDVSLPDAPDLDTIPFFAAGDNGFYLRADAGFGSLTAGKALTANGRFSPGLSGGGIAGIGAGYRFAHVLRADITAEYRSRTNIRTADGARAHISGATVLANVYADLGTWYGVTPYVGAGVGAGWNGLSVDGAFGGNGNRADLVWAVGGGFAFAVTPQASIDVGYRYLHTGTRRSAALALRESGSHDLRIGLRWNFGAGASAELP
ncbi:outer membrane protein [Pseudochelatococcus contaminans]|uniref:Opacity protein-like surface antigen n=1 Tax=Pseudochelatococcus contaminans TaxID=1538103 RepID=A0A7W6EFW2_9HYPH|nr:outer membrane beta-barrel protein [Pseudochelatococcus contaminans]MBB3809046.1 opacity protein-like surface antigen [Pseudochelatococcus contaminans]